MVFDSLIDAAHSNLFAIGIVVVLAIIVIIVWKDIGKSEQSETIH